MNLALQLEEIEKQVSALISENIEYKKQLTEAKKLIKGMNKYLSTKPEFWSKEEMFEIAELSEKAYQFVKEKENGR
jgi:5-bromo-4-chloroindolyl phosphate hydrolysis protein